MSKELQVKFKVLDFGVWILENARISFPHIWKVGKFEGEDKPNYDASFLIPIGQKKVAKEIQREMVKLAQTINSKIKKVSEIKHPKMVKSKDKKHWVVKSSNQLDRPAVYFESSGSAFHGDPLSIGADRVLYAGCHVRAKLKLNPDTVGGKVKLWSNLEAIQFMSDGERLGSSMDEDELQEGFDEVESEMESSHEGDDDDEPKKKKSKSKDKKKGKGKKSKGKGKKSKDDDFDDDDFDDDDDF